MGVRDFLTGDEAAVWRIYRRAFAGFPWFENLSDEEVGSRWLKSSGYPGFRCLVHEIDGGIRGATWWDAISTDRLRQERGASLADFARQNFSGRLLVWERDLIVDPDFQGRGIGRQLRQAFLAKLTERGPEFVVLTRMRQDNIPTLKLAGELGFKSTGIRVPCSVAPGIFHEYWFCDQTNRQEANRGGA